MKPLKIFYDTETTSVSRDADLISIGLVTEVDGITHTFYAESTSFNEDKADDWVITNVIKKLQHRAPAFVSEPSITDTVFFADTEMIKLALKDWLLSFGRDLEFIADFDVTDKPILIDLISKFTTKVVKYPVHPVTHWQNEVIFKVGLPEHIANVPYYAFYDFHTLLWFYGIDPDISREDFVKSALLELPKGKKHNALYDAKLLSLCFSIIEKQRMLLKL